MKRLLITTAVVATAFATQASAIEIIEPYVKYSAGSSFGKQEFDKQTSATNPNFGLSSKNTDLKGLTGGFAIGTLINENFGVEGIFNYKYTDRNNKNRAASIGAAPVSSTDGESIVTPGTGVSYTIGGYTVKDDGGTYYQMDTNDGTHTGDVTSQAFPGNKDEDSPTPNVLISDATNTGGRVIAPPVFSATTPVSGTTLNSSGVGMWVDNASNKVTERGFNLGVKATGKFDVNEKISLNAGLGLGVNRSQLSINSKGTVTGKPSSNIHAITYKIDQTIKSEYINQPFGLVSIGTEYNIDKNVSFGIEYTGRFNAKKEYEADSAIKGGAIHMTYTHGTAPDNQGNLVVPNGNSLASGKGLGLKTGGFTNAVMATVKVGF